MNGFKPTSVVVDGPVCIGNWCPQNYGRSYSGAITLIQAITRSINVIPVKLSIALGKGNAKVGRAMIVATARRFGIKAPLPDTPSLPIGADEVAVLEHTVAYATFPNRGMAVTPHAILEVRSGTGETIWRFDRDGKKPTRAIPESVASDMAFMMSKVVEEGTARRAILDGMKSAGKTGTTNSYRDAWFVGYTGNFVCGVWFGNDDYRPAQPHDRRLAAGADLARHHGLCPPGCGAKEHPRPRAEQRLDRPRARGQQERGVAANHADQQGLAGFAAGRAAHG